jgi:hypothetical protein
MSEFGSQPPPPRTAHHAEMRATNVGDYILRTDK